MELKSLDKNSIPKVRIERKLPEPSSQVASSDRAGTQASILNLKTTERRDQIFEVRNKLINISNIAALGVDEATEAVKSLTDNRSSGAEEVGNLTKQLDRIAELSTPDGTKPLIGEPLNVALEEGDRTFQFPNDLVKYFGLSEEKEPSEETIREVQNRLEDFRKRSKAIISSIRESARSLEVAAQNSEAAQTSVRAVDSAISLARNTGSSITLDPGRALESNPTISPTSLRLID